MNNKYGFTLLELLIAAAIIGVLAIFATQSFRGAGSEVRLQDARVRARMLAVAARRYYREYPNAASLEGKEIGKFNTVSTGEHGSVCNPEQALVQNLMNCGFLEKGRQFASEYGDGRSNFKMKFTTADQNGVTVCLQCRAGSEGRILDHRTYCTDGERELTPEGSVNGACGTL